MGWSISGKQGPVRVEEVLVTDQAKKSYSLCDAICEQCQSQGGSTSTGSTNELRAAQNYLVKRAQVESCSDEIQCLEMGQEIH